MNTSQARRSIRRMHTNSSRSRLQRSGFTLIEILLVAAILVIMASMATYGFLAMQKSATSRLTRSEIGNLESACTSFAINHNGRLPNKLLDLFQLPAGENEQTWGGPYMKTGDTRDPWGSEYQYTPNQQTQEVLIVSAGPDGQMGTEDDVSNQQVN